MKRLAVAALACVLAGSLPARAAPRRLACKHVDEATFRAAYDHAQDYGTLAAAAGLLPHHLTAAPMLGGFFKAAGGETYDTIVLVGPNHSGEGDAVLSKADWDFGSGVACDTDMVERLRAIPLRDARLTPDDARMEDDHALSVFIPFIAHSFPGAQVAPLLVSRALTYGDVLRLADGIADAIAESGKRVLLLASADFSHGLTPAEARERDAKTRAAMAQRAYGDIFTFTNEQVDSPAALLIFLRYLERLETPLIICGHSDASQYTYLETGETTSYFVLAGVWE